MAKVSDRFPRVDSMRAIAALCVVAFHLNSYTPWPSGSLQPLALHADIGVPILFLISAFLLYRPFVAAHVRGKSAPPLIPYTARRVARIVPAYWIATTIVGLILGQQYLWTFHGFTHIYGFLQIYSSEMPLGGLGVSWTLCVEVTLYIALPLFAWAARRLAAKARLTPLRAHWWVVGALFAAGVVYQLVAVRFSDPNLYTTTSAPVYLPFPAYMDEFALGMGLAVWSVAAGAGQPWAARTHAWLVARASWPGFAAIAIFLVMAFALDRKGLPSSGMSDFVWLLRRALYGLLALLLLVPAVLQGESRGLVQRVLSSRALRGIGLVAYGIYLFHGIVIYEIGLAVTNLHISWLQHPDSLPSKFVFTLLALAAVTLVGTLSYVIVERPAQRLARRVGRRPSAPAPATAPAASGG